MTSLNDPECPEISTNGQFAEHLAVSREAAHAGGQILVHWLGKANVSEKNPGDYVTQADLESQTAIEQLIRQHFPDHGFLGEESDISESARREQMSREFCWVVDPLDGTTNFIHQLRSFSVSVGMLHRGKLAVGTVYDPILQETYWAAAGSPAMLNDQPIRVSQQSGLDRSLLICSFPTRPQIDSPELARFTNLLCNSGATLRRLGSAALNLCYVAGGRADGYWATSVNSWDVAAGALILQQAGGCLRHIDGGPFDIVRPEFVATSTPELYAELASYLTL